MAKYSYKFKKQLVKEEQISQSMCRKSNCLDNAVMENFFSLLKQEIYYGARLFLLAA